MSNKYLLASLLAVSLAGVVACEKEVAPLEEEVNIPQDNLVEMSIKAEIPVTKSTFDGRTG